MTYAEFLAVFLLPPVVLLLGWLGLRRRLGRRLAFALGLTAGLAVVYTGPWDAMVVTLGVWAYPADRVLGPTVGPSRVEEYAFFVLQVLFAGLLAAALDRGEAKGGQRA